MLLSSPWFWTMCVQNQAAFLRANSLQTDCDWLAWPLKVHGILTSTRGWNATTILFSFSFSVFMARSRFWRDGFALLNEFWVEQAILGSLYNIFWSEHWCCTPGAVLSVAFGIRGWTPSCTIYSWESFGFRVGSAALPGWGATTTSCSCYTDECDRWQIRQQQHWGDWLQNGWGGQLNFACWVSTESIWHTCTHMGYTCRQCMMLKGSLVVHSYWAYHTTMFSITAHWVVSVS